MGCGASTDKPGPGPKPAEDPELIGKAKFLSCPALSEITDPATGKKWVLMVFAPQTHHGLIFSARCHNDGKILVKDILDKQVQKEKEEQRVQLSFNLFFKTISTEVSKAMKTGARVEWRDGMMVVECKIAISSAPSTAKRPDTYTVQLTEVESSEANLFKYFAEPLATHYSKKRTEGWNLDRPDPHKERMYGEQEATAIVRTAAIRRSQKKLDALVPALAPLRQDHATARAERDAAVAKLNFMKQMLAERRLQPSVMRYPPDDVFAEMRVDADCVNPVAAAQEPNRVFPTVESIQATRKADAVCADGVAPAMSEEELASRDSFVASGDVPLVRVGFAAFSSWGAIDGERLTEGALRKFLREVESLHRQHNVFHNNRRAAERMQAMHVLMSAVRDKLCLSPQLTVAALVATAVHDVDHCGLSNQFGAAATSLAVVPVVYGHDSAVERHSLAVGLFAAKRCNIPADPSTVATLVLATDLAKHQDFMQGFEKRQREVADFGRRHDDSALALALLLKIADLCHLYKSPEATKAAIADLAAELRNEASSKDLPASSRTSGGPSDDDGLALFVRHIAAPMFRTAASQFPGLAFVVEGCARMHPTAFA